MEAKKITFGQLAESLGISKQTLTRKLKGTTEWTYPEMMKLVTILGIDNPTDFFF